MGKRSDFVRRERDWYPTPLEAVRPLLRHLSAQTKFCEPCAGDGQLVDHLRSFGHLPSQLSDIAPVANWIATADARTTDYGELHGAIFITNPPWSRDVLHPIILNLSRQAPTWLLFDADWMHTRQSVPFMPYLRKIVSVGRVKWIPDSPFTGKDNCAWHLFDQNSEAPAQFIGRAA